MRLITALSEERYNRRIREFLHVFYYQQIIRNLFRWCYIRYIDDIGDKIYQSVLNFFGFQDTGAVQMNILSFFFCFTAKGEDVGDNGGGGINNQQIPSTGEDRKNSDSSFD